MHYEVYGPFDVPRTGKAVDIPKLKDFWDNVEAEWEGLQHAIGIYVYSSKHGRSFTPWYVGMTCAKSGFKGEVFQDHKVKHYLASADFKKAPAVIHLIPRVSPGRQTFSKPSAAARRDIAALETVVIAMAWRANKNVRNSKKLWFNKNCFVPGILGPASRGRRPRASATLRMALHLD